MSLIPLTKIVNEGHLGFPGRISQQALEAKYRLDDDSRIQTLHDKFASQEVTQAEGFDPARVIQEIRRICVELGQLLIGEITVAGRKIHAFLGPLPDYHNESPRLYSSVTDNAATTRPSRILVRCLLWRIQEGFRSTQCSKGLRQHLAAPGQSQDLPCPRRHLNKDIIRNT